MSLTNLQRSRVGRPAVLVVIAWFLVCALANAALIPVLVSGPTPDGSNFAYDYRIDLLSDESLNPTGTSGMTCPGPSNTLVQCVPTGTFVTIYDIPGLASVTVNATGWGASIQPTGTTPSTINGPPIDDPGVLNVTFFYTGPEIDAGGVELSFTGFQIDSTMSGTHSGNFSFQATKDTGDETGNTDQGDGPTTIPGAATQGETTPEPASLMLLGGGLMLLGVGRRFFRRS